MNNSVTGNEVEVVKLRVIGSNNPLAICCVSKRWAVFANTKPDKL